MEEKKHYLTVENTIRETVNLYTDNFFYFWMPYICVIVPVNLLFQYLEVQFAGNPALTTLFTILSSIASTAVGLYVIFKALDKYRDRSSSPQDHLAKTRRLLVRYILLQILIILGVTGGIFLLIVPGIIFSLRWAVSPAAFAEEDLKVVESLKRSKALTKGFKGTIFGVVFLFLVINAVLYFFFSFIAHSLTGVGNFATALSTINLQRLSPISILYTIVSSLFGPLYALLPVVLYFNLRKEKEGFHVEELAESFLDDGRKETDTIS